MGRKQQLYLKIIFMGMQLIQQLGFKILGPLSQVLCFNFAFAY